MKTLADPKGKSASLEAPSVSPNPAEFVNNTIPWTIVNRYYTAEVHFEIKVYTEFVEQHAIGVPAVIYVWYQGEVSGVFCLILFRVVDASASIEIPGACYSSSPKTGAT